MNAAVAENFAVMLNANAKRVNPVVKERIARLVAPENIYTSHTEDESRDMATEIASRDFPVVFTGGGDGTFVKFVNDYADRQAGAMPNIGVIPLGTGNAIASIVSSGNYECDLRSYVDRRHRDTQLLQLVECEGSRFPFGGLGWDAEVLNDYVGIKKSFGQTPLLGKMLQNVGGYFAAFFGRTMPRNLARMVSGKGVRNEVRITNLGKEAHALYGGNAVKAYGPGDVLYEGPTNITMFGTAPYYGSGFSVLPYSMNRTGSFQLRVVTMGMGKIVSNLRTIWKGRYVGPDIIDWHVNHVKMEFSNAIPYQYGGDAKGYRNSVELKLSPTTVDLLRFI